MDTTGQPRSPTSPIWQRIDQVKPRHFPPDRNIHQSFPKQPPDGATGGSADKTEPSTGNNVPVPVPGKGGGPTLSSKQRLKPNLGLYIPRPPIAVHMARTQDAASTRGVSNNNYDTNDNYQNTGLYPVIYPTVRTPKLHSEPPRLYPKVRTPKLQGEGSRLYPKLHTVTQTVNDQNGRWIGNVYYPKMLISQISAVPTIIERTDKQKEKFNSHLQCALWTTFLANPICGGVGIYFAVLSNQAYNRGETSRAYSYSRVAFILSLFGVVLTLIIYIMLAASGELKSTYPY